MFESQKDNVGMEATKQRGLDNVKRGRDGEAYSEEQEGAAFDNLTKTENSLRSYLNDEWLGGDNFSGSMSSKIDSDISAAYQVHLAHPSIQSFDIPVGDGETNWYDNITKEDKALIKQRLMNPETEEELAISREVAREHYINAQRQQHEKGVKEAENAAAKERGKHLDKIGLKQLDGNIKLQLQNAKSQDEINKILLNAKIDSNKITETTSQEVDKVAAKIDLVNPNWKKGDPEEEKNLVNVSTDQMRAIDEGLADPNMRGVVGNFGYYYKDAQDNIRQFKNKQDFIKKQKIKQKDGESEDEAIARFNASKGSTGVAGGKATSIETIRSDEQLDAAQDKIIDKTSTKQEKNPMFDDFDVDDIG